MTSGSFLLLKRLGSSSPGPGGWVGNDQDEETDVELSASDQQRPFDVSLHDPPTTPGFVVRGVYDAQDVLVGKKKTHQGEKLRRAGVAQCATVGGTGNNVVFCTDRLGGCFQSEKNEGRKLSRQAINSTTSS